MVEGHAQVHHRPHDDLAIHDNRLLHGPTQPQYRHLRRVYDGSEHVDVIVGERGYCEPRACHVVDAKRVLSGLVCERANLPGNAQQVQRVGSSEHRHNEAVRDNPDLLGLELSGVSLSPRFNRNVTEYTASVGDEVSSITVSPELTNTLATYSIASDADAQAADGEVDLAVGENLITVTVTSADRSATKTYTVAVTRAAQ